MRNILYNSRVFKKYITMICSIDKDKHKNSKLSFFFVFFDMLTKKLFV